MDVLMSTVSVFADWHHDGPGWWIVFPLFWILVVIGIVFLLRARGPWGPPRFAGPARETALEVLERRYAQGEIGVDEYRERRAVLTGHPERPGD
jgi:putative membrane protein